MPAINLATRPAPSNPERLRSFALGPQLHEWSNAFQPDLLDTASQALASVQTLVQSTADNLSTLTASRDAGLFTRAECQEEELRLTLLLERQVAMLEKLGTFHSRTTSVSAAALLHAMTRGRLASDSERQERNATPRRSLASASDLVDA